MAEDYTVLNSGTGGDVMDEEGLTYGSPPLLRKRPRVVLAGAGLTEIARVKDAAPSANDLGLVTRVVTSGVIFSIDDAGSSITIDAAVTSPVAARLSDGTSFLTTASGRLAVDGSGVTQPISGTVAISSFPDNEPFNIAQVAGTATSVNTGNADTGTQRVVLASNQPLVTVSGVTSIYDGGNSITVDGTVTVNAGTGIFVTSGVAGIWDNGNSITVDGTVNIGNQPTVTVSGNVNATVTNSSLVVTQSTPASLQATVTAASAFPVTDNAGSLTVDAPVGTPVATRLSDGSAFFLPTMSGQLPTSLISGRLDVNVGNSPSVSVTSVPANQSVNLAQVTGTATSVGVGNSDAGTQRVVLASNQPQVLVSGVVTANAGTGSFTVIQSTPSSLQATVTAAAAFPVTDNSSSLTVDAPTNTPLPVRGSDGSSLYNLAQSGQFPASLVNNRLDINVGNSPTVIVSGNVNATVTNTSLIVTQATPASLQTTVTPAAGQVFPVSDNAGSLTIDAPVGTPVAVRASDGSAFYHIAHSGQFPTSLVSGRLDVNIGNTPTVIVSGNVNANITNTPAVNLSQIAGVAASVGAGNTDTGTQRVVIATNQGTIVTSGVTGIWDNGNSITVDGTVNIGNQPTVTVSGNVIATVSNTSLVVTQSTPTSLQATVTAASAFPVTDNAGSLTVDAPVGTPVAVRQSDGSAFIIPTLSGQLPAALISGRLDVSVGNTPTVTANAGTNLNTSALALETTATSIKNAVEIIDNAISGSEMQVDVIAALPAGDNNIGNVDIVSLPNEGQQTMANSISVAISSDQSAVPVSGTVTANAGTGVFDVTPVSPAAGDYLPVRFTNSTIFDPVLVFSGNRASNTEVPGGINIGVLPAIATASGPSLVEGRLVGLSTDLSGALRITGGAAGGTSITDDSAFSVGSTALTPVGGTYKSTRDLVDDNDAGAFAMTQKRSLITAIETMSGMSAMDEVNGALRVNIIAGAGSGGTAMTDDAAFTVAVTSFTPIGGTYRSTRDLVDDADAGAFAMTQRRGMLAVLETVSGVTVVDEGKEAVRVTLVGGSASDGAIVDGVSSAIKATVLDFANSNPLAVRLTDTAGDYVTAGGGTQYADGAAQGTPTGTVALGHDGSNVRAITTDSSGDLQVDVLTVPGNLDIRTLTVARDALVVTQSGTWSVNVGTFPSNQPFNMAQVAGIATSVNIGNADAGTIRAVLASNQPQILISGVVTANAGTGTLNTNVTNASLVVSQGTPANLQATVTAAAAFPVTDNAGSLTIDAPVGTPVAIRASDGSAFYHIAQSGQFPTSLVGGRLDVNIGNTPTVTANAGTGVFVTSGVAGIWDNGNSITVDGTVNIGTFPANQAFNLAQIVGTTTSVNAGNVDAGTQRVVIATDQSRLLVSGVNNNAVQGDTAHDDVDIGNPVKIGGYASSIAPPNVSDGDRVNAWFSTRGIQGTFLASTTGSLVDIGNISSDGISVTKVTIPTSANQYIFNGTTWDRVRGTSGVLTFSGTKTNNTSAPLGTNLGVLPAVATTAGPSYSEGNQVALSTDLSGALRVTGGAGGTNMTDDAGFSPGSTSFTPAGGTYRSTRDLVDDNDAGAFAMTQRRGLLTALETTSGITVMDEANEAVRVRVVAGQATVFSYANSKPLAVRLTDTNGDYAAAGGGTEYADKAAFTEGTSGGIKAAGAVFNDTISGDPAEDQITPLRITAKKGLHTNLRNTSGIETGTDTTPLVVTVSGIQGDAQHDAPDFGKPIKIGGRASSTTPIPVVTDGDRVNAWFGPQGAQSVFLTAGVQGGAATFLQPSTDNLSVGGGGLSGLGTLGFGYLFNGSGWDRVRGAGGILTVSGNRANNSVYDGTNFGVLPAISTVAAPSYSENRQVALSTDLTGALRVTGAAGGVSHIDDTAFTPASDDVVPAAAFFNDSTPDSVNEGDAGILRMSANRNLYSTIRDAAGNERGVNVTAGNALVVDGSAVTQPVSGTVNIGTFPDNEPFNLNQWGGTSTTLGQKAMTASVPVVMASDQSNINIAGTVTANAGTGDFLSIAAHTINEAFKEANAVGGQLDDTGTTAATENNIAPVRITAQRAFHTNLRNDGGTEIGTAGTPIRTDPTGTTAQPANITQVNGNAVVTAGTGLLEVAVLPVITSPISSAGVPLPIKFIRVNATADGDNTIITGVTNKEIKVISYALAVTAAGTISIQDTGGTPGILAQFPLAANGGVSFAGGINCPAFQTATSSGVEINNPASVDTLGHMSYIVVDPGT